MTRTGMMAGLALALAGALSGAPEAVAGPLSGGGSGPFALLAAEPTLSIDDVEAAEESEDLVFTVGLSAPSDQTVSVSYATALDGTATPEEDYVPASGQLTFAPGETSKQIVVGVYDDDLFEGDEEMYVDLSGAAGATIADADGTGYILDDEPMPTVTVDGVSGAEGTSPPDGTLSMIGVRLKLSGPAEMPIRVHVRTVPGTADASDVQMFDKTVEIAPGADGEWVFFDLVADSVPEADETFTFELLDADYATLGDKKTATVVIADDDGPTATIPNQRLAEGTGNSAPEIQQVQVVLNKPAPVDLNVTYRLFNGTAGGQDVTLPGGGVATFAAGATSATIAVRLFQDNLDEPDETFLLSPESWGPIAVRHGAAHGTITIVDDDEPATPPPPPAAYAAALLDAADMPRSSAVSKLCPTDRRRRTRSGRFEGHVSIAEHVTATWKLTAEIRPRTAAGRAGPLRRLPLGSKSEQADPFEVDLAVPISRARCTKLKSAMRRAYRGRGKLVLTATVKSDAGKTATTTSRLTLRR